MQNAASCSCFGSGVSKKSSSSDEDKEKAENDHVQDYSDENANVCSFSPSNSLDIGEKDAASKKRKQFVELGTIKYLNLSTPESRHGDFKLAQEAIRKAPMKPVFANFVEWPGCSGSQDAGRIFADPGIKHAAENLFVPVAFNTWDRGSFDPALNIAFKTWAGELRSSDWGYLRIIDSRDGVTVLSSTKQVTGYHQMNEVKHAMKKALVKLGLQVPASLE